MTPSSPQTARKEIVTRPSGTGGRLNTVYQERRSRLPDVVAWRREPGAGPRPPVRILPDGCLDLIWGDGTLFVAGPDTAARLTRPGAGASYGLRFGPGLGPLLLGVPAGELRDRQVPLQQLWPDAEARRARQQVGDSADRLAALEALAARLRAGAEPDPVVGRVLAGLRRGDPVAATAGGAGLTERTLHRRCLAAFGYGPKTLARILRLHRALEGARADIPFARLAADTGYADQAHLAREVRALAGVPLRELLQTR
jgi:AraC-like DNA-binding protein